MEHIYTLTSESLGEGHPDKICDTIADAIVDYCLSFQRSSRVGIDVLSFRNTVTVAGNITSSAPIELEKLIREVIHQIGYTNIKGGFSWSDIMINNITRRLPYDIAGCAPDKSTRGYSELAEVSGYACDETQELMPAPIMYAHRITRELTRLRKTGVTKWLRPDTKCKVAVEYMGGVPKRIVQIVLDTQHSEGIRHREIARFCAEKVIRKVLPGKMLTKETQIIVNPFGRHVSGGPDDMPGVSSRRVSSDTYGGIIPLTSRGFSGLDPQHIERYGTYMARYIAKNVVAAGLANKCHIRLTYYLGASSEPTEIFIDTSGTSAVPDSSIVLSIKKVFELNQSAIIKRLRLLKPIYSKATNYGHFGKRDPDITWEKTDKAILLRKEAVKTSGK